MAAERRARGRPIAHPEVWALTALSAVLHFWRLLSPNALVFDEVYFEKFAGYYRTGGFVFDVHPPLGRLLYGAEAFVLGLSPSALIQGDAAPTLRLLPALCGTAIVPLVYLLLRQLQASRKVATFAGIALLLENALLVDTRLVLTEVFLIVFGLIALNAFLAARDQTGRRRLRRLTLAAFAAGCAVSVKWTGASALGLIGVTWMIELATRRAPASRWVREGAVLVFIPIAVYLSAFAVDFARVSHEGYRSLWMTERFRKQLPGSGEYDPAAPRLGYVAKLIDTHRGILRANAAIGVEENPQSSPWYTWPIMKHPIALWAGKAPDGKTAMMQLLGNPVVWWGGMLGTLAGVALFATALARRRRAELREYEYGFYVLLGGAAFNFVPFMFIHRMMYLYHYLYALVFVVALAAYIAGIALGWMGAADAADPGLSFATPRARRLYWGAVGVMLLAFVYFAPFTYGLGQTDAAIDRRFWVLHPRL